MKDISSRAEVTLEYPDKTYIGIFERHSRYAVGFDEKGVILKLEHPGEDHKLVDIHIAYALFADMVRDLGAMKAELAKASATDRSHLVDALREAAHDLNERGTKRR